MAANFSSSASCEKEQPENNVRIEVSSQRRQDDTEGPPTSRAASFSFSLCRSLESTCCSLSVSVDVSRWMVLQFHLELLLRLLQVSQLLLLPVEATLQLLAVEHRGMMLPLELRQLQFRSFSFSSNFPNRLCRHTGDGDVAPRGGSDTSPRDAAQELRQVRDHRGPTGGTAEQRCGLNLPLRVLDGTVSGNQHRGLSELRSGWRVWRGVGGKLSVEGMQGCGATGDFGSGTRALRGAIPPRRWARLAAPEARPPWKRPFANDSIQAHAPSHAGLREITSTLPGQLCFRGQATHSIIIIIIIIIIIRMAHSRGPDWLMLTSQWTTFSSWNTHFPQRNSPWPSRVTSRPSTWDKMTCSFLCADELKIQRHWLPTRRTPQTRHGSRMAPRVFRMHLLRTSPKRVLPGAHTVQ
ncbi:hypothetical protein EYF80_031078 [Liparis tanakae]|uniref:Uncharacterized protein n=1 Tax=Liparis tanakae TaxID=230148 RepID=A0A4Z2H1F9_9TELE|nr:hypothetical protein EYF80_031078 [Liparis tanakae]